jgi:lipopolysaccharide export system permease protein
VVQRTLFRYFISEVLPPFLLGIFAFTLILLIGRILKLVELVITRGVPLQQTVKLFSLILPTFLELTVPMSFLLAILLGLGRMSNDQELLAMKAAGVGPWQILLPLAVVSIVIALVTLSLTLFARPAANFALKKELYNIAKTRIGTALKEKVFNDDFPKILFYIEEIKPPGNTAQGIFIVDKRDPAREEVILGKVGIISTDEETNTLAMRLFDGSIYSREKNRPGFSETRFNIYDFKVDLDELIGTVRQKEAGPKELPLEDLLARIDAKERQGNEVVAERMELHQRIAFGFVPLVFCLLGVSLALVPRQSRASRASGFMLCLFWLMSYYALLSLGKALGEKTFLPPMPALWLPNMTLIVIASFFFRKALHESPLVWPARVEHALSNVRRRFTRRRSGRKD